jgi:hypothetical protein
LKSPSSVYFSDEAKHIIQIVDYGSGVSKTVSLPIFGLKYNAPENQPEWLERLTANAKVATKNTNSL